VEPALDPTILKAISHPLRYRVLTILARRVASPRQMADELGEPLGRIGHHVRVLAQLGAIELVETRPRRGAIEHFYRAVVRPAIEDDVWAGLPRGTRRGLLAEPLRRGLEEAATAAAGSGFDDALMHLSVTYLQLDHRGREQVAETLREAFERVTRVEAEARERAGESDLEPTELVMLHFDRPEG
jgi:DNA-binding transcriptional ArsR family regulator